MLRIALHDCKLSKLSINTILACLFFFSGSASLMYQLIWERMLYVGFGVDLFSITIIVSVFMFGLGLGALMGGWIADTYRNLITAYIMIEISIGLFGFFSPYLIKLITHVFLSQHIIMTVIGSFCLLALPTALMGMTFPILVAHVNKTYGNIAVSVSNVYFANTLGAAFGAYFTGFICLKCMDAVATIYHAAFLNVTIALVTFLIFRPRQTQ